MTFNANTGTKRERAPEIAPGVYPAICYMIVDLGTHETEWAGEVKHSRKGRFGWEIPSLRIDIERDGKTISMPRVISEVWTISTGRKSNLRPILESWDGKEMEGDYPSYDLESLVGRQCTLQIMHKKSTKGDEFAKVKNVLPASGEELKAENHPVYFSFDDDGPLPEIMASGKLNWVVTTKYYGMQDSAEYSQKARQADVPADVTAADTAGMFEEAVDADGDMMPF